MDKAGTARNDTGVCVSELDILQNGEVGGEFTMPDYYPEIRKVINVTADALPDSKYLSQGALEIGGTVAFCVLYLGDDGSLCSAPYVTEYQQSVALSEGWAEGSDKIMVETAAFSPVCRPLAPRTLSLKAKIKSRVMKDGVCDCAMKLMGEDMSPLSMQARSYVNRLERKCTTAMCQSFYVTGSVVGEKSFGAKMKPISCKGSVAVEKVIPGNDFVTVRGRVELSCLCLSCEGVYKTVYHAIPLEERVSAEGADSSSLCGAHGRAASVTVSGDEGGNLSFEAEYDIDVILARIKNASITEDVYSTACDMEEKRERVKAKRLVCIENSTAFLQGEGLRKSKQGTGDYIINADCVAKVENATVSKGTVTFAGSCTFKVMIASEGEVVTEEFTLPFTHECGCPDVGDMIPLVWSAVPSSYRPQCNIEEGKISCECSIALFVSAFAVEELFPVTEAVATGAQAFGEDDSIVKVCYPEKGKRVWDVVKEVKGAIADCERLNRVSRNDICTGEALIIR